MFEFGRSLAQEPHRKRWSEVVRRGLEEWKVRKELVVDKNVHSVFIKTCLPHLQMEKHMLS